jgi:DNA-binding beta-propeller fold protein YncE
MNRFVPVAVMVLLSCRTPGKLSGVVDVPLPGNPTRFDYQDIDAARGRLVIAHMGDSEVVVVNLSDGSVAGRIPGIDTVRGIAVASDRIFATAMNGFVVTIDSATLKETGRSATGLKPDGVAWDPVHAVVATSDQGEGALSLIAGSTRTPVQLGKETGNVVFDAGRGLFWVTVVRDAPPDQLVSVDPVSGAVKQRIDVPGCGGAHGLRIHPDGKSALIACEDNNTLARLDLSTSAVVTAPTGADPDVLSIDPGLGWLYVAAESGDVVIFDIGAAGLNVVSHEHPGDHAHSVAVDPSTHRVYFPLLDGPTLRVMQPKGM